jgi:hypothetical protein
LFLKYFLCKLIYDKKKYSGAMYYRTTRSIVFDRQKKGYYYFCQFHDNCHVRQSLTNASIFARDIFAQRIAIMEVRKCHFVSTQYARRTAGRGRQWPPLVSKKTAAGAKRMTAGVSVCSAKIE